MLSLQNNPEYIENITAQQTTDTDWVETGVTTFSTTPPEVTLDSSTTNVAIITPEAIAVGDKLSVVNTDNTYNDITLSTVTTVPGAATNKLHKQNLNSPSTLTAMPAWVTDTNVLPSGLDNSQAIVTSSRVYLLGGYNGSVTLSTIYSCPINSDGTLGTWVTESNALPGVLNASQAVVTSSRVYLLGGNNGSSLSSIYSCLINTDGTLGTWITESNTLPVGLARTQAVVTSSRVYLLGGYTSTYTATIQSCPINADGTLGTWITETNTLPIALPDSQAVVTSSRVYLLGGFNGTYLSAIYSCPINADGTLGVWVTESNTLPTGLTWSQAIVTSSRVYTLGGNTSVSTTSAIYSCPINADGTLGTWITETNTLPNIFRYSQAVVTRSLVTISG